MASNKWWNCKEDEVHLALVPLVNRIKENQLYRSQENLKHARLYGNLDILGLTSSLYARPQSVVSANRVTFNIIQSCVDTASAKIAKNKPYPTFLTDGGDWSMQQKAKKLQKCVSGQFYANRTYEETAKSFVDGGVLGTGLIKVFDEWDEVKNERLLSEELLVDDAEALYGKPRNLYQIKPVSRDVLKAQFPEFETDIDQLKSIDVQNGFMSFEHADMVEAVEGWHLPSGKDTKDGRHAIVINGVTLFCEPWEEQFFPFAKFSMFPRLVGWYAQGIAEQLVGIQVQINKMLRDMQISDHLNSAPAWLVENNSKIVSAHINNEIGHIIKYEGIPPELRVWATYHPQKAQQLENLFQKAYQLVGISEMSAQAEKPAGLNSGKALREFNDIESERFIQVGQRWEQFHMDIARLNVWKSRQIYKRQQDFKITTRSKKFIKTIKWAEVDMDDDKYQMQIFPTSSLPQTPAGRMQFVQEMMTSGLIDPDTGLELLDFPDLDTNSNLKFAARNVARETVEMILDDGKYRAPEPFDDLKFLLMYAQMSYNYARIHNCPEDKLELLRRLMGQAKFMLDTAAASEAPPALPMDAAGGPAPAVGAPPPLPVAPLMQAQGR